MSKKGIIGVIALLLLVVLAVLLFGDRGETVEENVSDMPLETPTENQEAEDREVRGTVVSVDTTQAMIDGPFLITLAQENGEHITVAIASMGIRLCEARDNIADVATLKEGQVVEVRGAVQLETTIFPCESRDHYLRVVQN